MSNIIDIQVYNHADEVVFKRKSKYIPKEKIIYNINNKWNNANSNALH